MLNIHQNDSSHDDRCRHQDYVNAYVTMPMLLLETCHLMRDIE